MRAGERSVAGARVVYCLVPADLASKLHTALRRHFVDDSTIEVVVERRLGERRAGGERREGDAVEKAERGGDDRSLIRNDAGRRTGDRRAVLASCDPPALPRRARPYADRLVFVE